MSDRWPPQGLATLDELQAFDAMFNFLHIYWEQGGRGEEEIAGLLGSLGRGIHPPPGTPPIDIALWDDWREAVAKALAAPD